MSKAPSQNIYLSLPLPKLGASFIQNPAKMRFRCFIFLLIASPLFAADMSVQGEVLRFDGDISVGDDVTLSDALLAHPNVTTIELNSRGGDVYTAMQMASKIRGSRLVTRVVGNCLSACTVTFIGGGTRELAADGEIGFHRVQDVKTGAYLAFEDPLYNRLTMLTWRLGIDPILFIQWMNLGTIDDLFFPSKEELCEANVITKC